jgi:hypothetical protein
MRSSFLGLLEYLLVIGLVLAVAIYELYSVRLSQRRDRRMRKGNSERTHAD